MHIIIVVLSVVLLFKCSNTQPESTQLKSNERLTVWIQENVCADRCESFCLSENCHLTYCVSEICFCKECDQ
ncbi:hypothetical protein RN001_007112 [Aquatica leii]|uniref:Uncharacterized protein n=1 Tax=Aquatica leii TaxID=1421715 RepID=A0AAN7PB83_9COLE|nr:hypothetical protein RN001_007112 [Aquatica leii]